MRRKYPNLRFASFENAKIRYTMNKSDVLSRKNESPLLLELEKNIVLKNEILYFSRINQSLFETYREVVRLSVTLPIASYRLSFK